jgi:drug/metabolite transporter (DMT)-like permease
MSGAAETAVAVLAGLAAACSFGMGVALQHRQVQLVPLTGRAPFRLLVHLVRRRLWLAGIALAAAAYGLQALALAFGPLALVAPVVALDLLFAIPFAARWSRQPMRAVDWGGCALAAAGVAVFLAAAPPAAGRANATAGDWVFVFAVVTLLAAVMVTAAMRAQGPLRAALLAVAAGAVFGLTAALTLSLARLLREGQGSIFGQWQLWALLVLGIIGLLLSASAFQAGALPASLPIMDTVEPLSAVLIGTLAFGERLAASPAGLMAQLAGAVSAVAGIILLGRSPLAARAYSDATGGTAPSAPSQPKPSRTTPEPAAAAPNQAQAGGARA